MTEEKECLKADFKHTEISITTRPGVPVKKLGPGYSHRSFHALASVIEDNIS